MFFSKRQRELDRQITESAHTSDDENAAVINVKVDSREQVFSPYSYSGDKLSEEFCSYIYERAKRAPITENIRISIHTKEAIDGAEIEQTLRKHYGGVYRETKDELRRVTTISLIMTVLGVITLALMALFNFLWDNFYVSTITEIAAWVFVWEAVDYFFLQRPLIKGRLILIQRIYTASVVIERAETDAE